MNASCGIRTALTASLLLAAGAAVAQDYPNRPLRMIVPYAAGGATDILARLLAPKLAELLGQSVVVENRPGGGTLLGTRAAVQSAPDGYTILLHSNTIATNALAYKSPGYRMSDLIPVAGTTQSAMTLSVGVHVPVNSLKDLIAYAKANPGKLNAVSLGNASITTIAYERFIAAAGISTQRINYGGSGPANQALIGGVVDVFMDGGTTGILTAKTGKARILATTFERRLPQIADVPTLKEEGFPTMVIPTWTGQFVPAKTPDAVVRRLRTEILKVLAMPDVRERIGQLGFEIWPGRQEEFPDFIREDVALYEKDIRRLGLALDE
jgi:tripartite-type tricarboxylate transporter receptor subunit TctC